MNKELMDKKLNKEDIDKYINPIDILEEEESINPKWFISERELDDEQYEILNLKDDNYLIEGCAGSGKTILAIHKVMQIIEENKGSYFFIVFTKILREFIESGLDDIREIDNKFKKSNVFYAASIEKKLKNDELPEVDYIIIDEVQDLDEKIITKLSNLCKKNFIFFGDDKQQIFSRHNKGINLKCITEVTNIPDENHLYLEKNYRLRKPIAQFAGRIVDDNGELASRCFYEVGEDPVIQKYNDVNEELDDIINIIKKDKLTDVAILVENNDRVKDVRKYLEPRGIIIEYKYDEDENTQMMINFKTTNPKVLTYHSSKGLQFDHVFLPKCEIDTTEYNYKEALYVACTRATKNLYISYVNKLSPFIKHALEN